MGNYGAKYVGYAQNAVNCGVECVYFATHTTHILKDLDFAFPSFAASIFCSNSKNYRSFSFYYWLFLYDPMSIIVNLICL